MVERVDPNVTSAPVQTANGERFIPGRMTGDIELEHVHRYRFAARLAVKATVLDIACGEGYGSAYLSQTAKRVIGVDISVPTVKAAKQHYQAPNLEFMVGSCSKIPLGDASVDVVVSFETIEHHAEHDVMMLEIRRVLRPRGLLIISTPDKLEYSDKPAYRNPFHVKELYREDFRSLLDAHFKSVRMFGQRVLEASALFSDRSGTGVLFDALGLNSNPNPNLPSPRYMLAVASNGKIPAIKGGLLEKPPAARQPETGGADTKLITLLIRNLSATDSKILRATLHEPWYLDRNSDIAAAGVDPYTHWMQYGAAEGRLPAAHVEELARNLIAERERPLRAHIAAREHSIRQAQETALARQRELTAHAERARFQGREEVEERLLALAERERLAAEKLLQQQKLADEERDAQRAATEVQLQQLAELHHKKEEALRAQLEERERNFRQYQLDAEETQHNLEAQLQALTARNTATTERLFQQQANADEQERQHDSARLHLRECTAQHHEREQVLLAMLAEKERDLRNIQRESAERRKDLEATIAQNSLAIRYAIETQRSPVNREAMQRERELVAQLEHTRSSARVEYEQQLRAMIERERDFAAEFARINDLVSEERRLLRDQYVAIVSNVRSALTNMHEWRPWRRAALPPFHINSLWDTAHASAYSLQDWISMRTPTRGAPNQVSLNAPAIATTAAGLDSPSVQGERKERSAMRAYSRVRTIGELLALDGPVFITCAYLTLLGRKPDKEGYSFYMDQLRQRGDKGAIVRQIGGSPEARRRSIQLKGMRSFIWRQKLGRIPILGALAAVMRRDSMNDDLRLVLEGIDHEIGTLEQGIADRLSRFTSQQRPSVDAQINALFKSFDAGKYVVANPDVGTAGLNPFEHFLRFGWFEGRQWPGRFRAPESSNAASTTPASGNSDTDANPRAGLESPLSDASPAIASASIEPAQLPEPSRWVCVMESAPETPDFNGPFITRLMQFIWRSRPDLQRAYDVHESTGRLGFLRWLGLYGIDELQLTARVFPKELLARLRSFGGDYSGLANQLLEAQDFANGSLQGRGTRKGEYAPVGGSDSAGANLIGYAFGEFGRGEDVRMVARSLNSSGVPLCIIDQDAGFHGTADTSAAAWVALEPRFDTNVFLINADVFPFLPFRFGDAIADGRYNVGYWAWELSRWPQDFDLALAMVDEVWAISEFVAQSVRTRARIPVFTMHDAVTVPDLGPGYTKSRYGVPDDSFVFYFIFDAASHLDRKNPLAVVKAFNKAFPDDQADVHLLLKTMNIDAAGPLWEQLLREVSGNPRITILSQRMSREEVLGLNLACDAFVSLHRSEGFGRCIAEAMAYGKPAVVTNYSGTRDFATADTACLVDYHLISVPDGAYPFSDGQVWADPDIEHAASQMQRIATDGRYRTGIALAGQKFIRENFSQEVMGRRYAKRLHDIREMRAMRSHMGESGAGAPSEPAQAVHGNIDSPSVEECREVSDVLPVEGWVASAEPIDTVKIYLGSAFIGDAHYGIPRPDIHAAYPQFADAGRSGFCYLLNIASLPDGEHSFSVVAHCRGGASRRWMMPFQKKEAFTYREWQRNAETLYARTKSVRKVRPRGLRLSLVLRLAPALDVMLLTRTLSSLAAQQDTRFELLVLLQDKVQESAVTQIASQVAPKANLRFIVGRSNDWESILANCPNELIGLADPGDIFSPWAFRELIASAQEGGQVDLVYGDEDCFDGVSRRDPTFKPAWSPIFLERFNYIGRPWLASRTVLASALTALKLEHKDASEHDLLKVIGQKSMVVAHVPTVLVSRSGAGTSAHCQVVPSTEATDWAVNTHWPKVSIIIPTRLGDEQIILKCFGGLEHKTDYPNLEVIVILNNLRDPGAKERYLATRAFKTIDCDGAFNWSKVNNIGASHASGDLLLFLNDDVEPLQDDWLKALVWALTQTGAAVAGSLLKYPNGTIQHAGVHFVNYGGGARHLLRFSTGSEPGLRWLSHFPREVSAVTGACLLTTRACFDAMNGFDEDLALVCNDTDFCLRVWQSRMSVIVQPEARLIHHEGISRTGMSELNDVEVFWKKWGKSLERGDLFTNPNLDSGRDDWTVNPNVEQAFLTRRRFVGGGNA